MKNYMNANLKKTQLVHEMEHYLKGHFYVMVRFSVYFTFRPSDLITTLTYVLVDNFCLCLY